MVLLLVALMTGAIAVHAIITGDAWAPGSHGSRSTHVSRATQRGEFVSFVRYYSAVSLILLTLVFLLRLNPVEDALSRLKERFYGSLIPYHQGPAPLWGYLFLIGFIALVLWIGWKVMYND